RHLVGARAARGEGTLPARIPRVRAPLPRPGLLAALGHEPFPALVRGRARADPAHAERRRLLAGLALRRGLRHGRELPRALAAGRGAADLPALSERAIRALPSATLGSVNSTIDPL